MANAAKEHGFRVTWATVTQESAEIGDESGRGWVDAATGERLDGQPDSAPAPAPLRDCLDLLEPDNAAYLDGLQEPDSSIHTLARSIRWCWIVWRDDGVLTETRTLHFPETLTGASRARLVALLQS